MLLLNPSIENIETSVEEMSIRLEKYQTELSEVSRIHDNLIRFKLDPKEISHFSLKLSPYTSGVSFRFEDKTTDPQQKLILRCEGILGTIWEKIRDAFLWLWRKIGWFLSGGAFRSDSDDGDSGSSGEGSKKTTPDIDSALKKYEEKVSELKKLGKKGFVEKLRGVFIREVSRVSKVKGTIPDNEIDKAFKKLPYDDKTAILKRVFTGLYNENIFHSPEIVKESFKYDETSGKIASSFIKFTSSDALKILSSSDKKEVGVTKILNALRTKVAAVGGAIVYHDVHGTQKAMKILDDLTANVSVVVESKSATAIKNKTFSKEWTLRDIETVLDLIHSETPAKLAKSKKYIEEVKKGKKEVDEFFSKNSGDKDAWRGQVLIKLAKLLTIFAKDTYSFENKVVKMKIPS